MAPSIRWEGPFSPQCCQGGCFTPLLCRGLGLGVAQYRELQSWDFNADLLQACPFKHWVTWKAWQGKAAAAAVVEPLVLDNRRVVGPPE